MVTLNEARAEIVRYTAENGLWIDLSDLYDLFPSSEIPAHPDVLHRWPEKWPNGAHQGIYLFFNDNLPEPSLLYIGRAKGAWVRIRTRLNDYFDQAAKRATKACVLLNEWKGYRRPWGKQPRYVITAAMKPDTPSGACDGAARLERHFIELFSPSENTQFKKKTRPTPAETASGHIAPGLPGDVAPPGK